MGWDREQGRYSVLSRRAVLLAGGQLALVGTLIGRMYVLEIMDAQRYTLMADENRINMRLLSPVRGRILDRFGVPLAVNQQNYRIVLVGEQVGNLDATLNAIATLVPLTDSDRHRVMRDLKRKHDFVPVVVRENLSWDEVSRIEVNVAELPGVSIELGLSRHYPFGPTASHILGYVAPVSEKELNGDPLLELPDFRIGKNGIERSRDMALRGAAGTTQIEVNAVGRVVREVSRNPGDAGRDLALTIDMALQDYATQRIAEAEAATCILMDAITGDILVMASNPAYDSNAFTKGLTAKMWQDLTTNPRGPLNNKTIQGVYPPGSTFKPVVAMAALEAGLITPDVQVVCTGKTALGDAVFHCYFKPGHGAMDLHNAIKHSCDIYFYELARRLGVDRIAAMADRLGLGRITGVDIPNERPGLIPTRAWKQAVFGVPWQNGETYSVGIGQGYVSATPIQLATMLARLVTNRAVVPRLLRAKGIMDHYDPAEDVIAQSAFAPLNLNQKHLSYVLGGMEAVTNERGGTAYAARIEEAVFAMGGKSGTAQVRHITQAERDHGLRKPEDVPWKDRDHALFIAFAPVGRPRYVCAVVIEHGVAGSRIAAPVARDILLRCQHRDPARQVPTGDPMQLADATGFLNDPLSGLRKP